MNYVHLAIAMGCAAIALASSGANSESIHASAVSNPGSHAKPRANGRGVVAAIDLVRGGGERPGAVVGPQVDKAKMSRDVYRVRVQMNSGGYETVTQEGANGLRVGDRARVENDRAYLLNEDDRARN